MSFIAKASLRGYFVRTWERDILGGTVFYLNVRPCLGAERRLYGLVYSLLQTLSIGITQLGLTPGAIQG